MAQEVGDAGARRFGSLREAITSLSALSLDVRWLPKVARAPSRFDSRELRSGLASEPGVYQFHWLLWRALHARGNDQEALGELIAVTTASGNVDQAQVLQQGGGYREAMRRMAALRESQAKDSPAA